MPKSSVPSSVSEYNQEIARLGKEKNWVAAMKLLSDMKPAGFRPNVVICCLAASSCSKGFLVDEMVTAVQVSYNSILGALNKNGQWKKALEIFNDFEKNGITPDTISFSSAITSCSKGKKCCSLPP